VSYYHHRAHGKGKSKDPEKWHVPSLSYNLFGQLFDDNQAPCVKYIIFYENLSQGVKELEHLLKNRKPCGSKIVRSNVSKKRKHKNYQKYYTPEMIKLVQEKCVRELEEFGYSFDAKCSKSLIKLDSIQGKL